MHLGDIDSYGFAVTAAWGTFEGGNWTSYCSGLLTHAYEAIHSGVVIDDSSSNTLEPYYFQASNGSSMTCKYNASWRDNLQTLPNVSPQPSV